MRSRIGSERAHEPGEVIRRLRRSDVTSVNYPTVGFTQRVDEVRALEPDDFLNPEQLDDLRAIAETELGIREEEDTGGIVINRPVMSTRGGETR